VERGARAAGSASAVLGAFMFGGGILVTPLLGLGPEGSPVPMALVVAGGALAALVAAVLLTRSAAEPAVSAR
jgi:DHA1 family bicyclomycin/chloramphenicol resistance-like MFS transporter